MTRLRSFTAHELDALARVLRANGVGPEAARPFPDIECPVCHDGRIVRYQYVRDRDRGPVMIAYVWCTSCLRYVGSTSVVPAGWEKDDPISRAEHAEYEDDGMEGLERMLVRAAAVGGAFA